MMPFENLNTIRICLKCEKKYSVLESAFRKLEFCDKYMPGPEKAGQTFNV